MVGVGVGLRKKRRREEKKGEGIEEKGRELLLFIPTPPPPPPPPPHFPLGYLDGRLIEVTTIEEPSLGRPKSGRGRLIEVAA